MPNFTITDVFTQDGHLVVRADHFHLDGSPWFTEHYTWQGREGLKQKQATNALGQPLLDDGTVAPTQLLSDPPRLLAVLPVGRTWLRQPAPYMVDDSLLSVIRATHRQRAGTGYPDSVDQLRTPKSAPADATGCPALLAKFQALIGRTE